MDGIVEVHIRVAEVQLQAEEELWVFRAPRELVERILLERVNGTKATKAIGKTGYLLAGPVVFGPHSRVLVLDPLSVRVPNWYATESTTARRISAESKSAIRLPA